MLKITRLVFVLVAFPFFVGCASVGSKAGGGFMTPTMSDAEYLKASTEEQEQYRSVVVEEDVLLTPKKDTEYMAGRPIYYGDTDTGYTVQWDKRLGTVFIYPGHVTDPMGLQTQAIAMFRADDQGAIHYQNVGGVEKPTTLLTNVATQEGIGRLFVKSGAQVLAGAANGAIAAQIRANHDCDDCGNTTLINAGGNNSAAALSNASSEAGAQVDINGLTW